MKNKDQIEAKLSIGDETLTMKIVRGWQKTSKELDKTFGLDGIEEISVMVADDVIRNVSANRNRIIDMVKKEMKSKK